LLISSTSTSFSPRIQHYTSQPTPSLNAMAEVSQAWKGSKALQEKRWDEAVDLLTKATAVTKSPSWLLDLAKAQQQTGDIAAALANTTLAYNVAIERANRKFMIDAQYRRAVLLYRAKRFADADVAAVWSQMLVEGVAPSKLKEYPTQNEMTDGLYNVKQEVVQPKQQKGKEKEGEWAAVQSAMGGSSGNTELDKKRDPAWIRAFQWRSMVLAALEKLAEDDQARKVTIQPAADSVVAVAAAKKVSTASKTATTAAAITALSTPVQPKHSSSIGTLKEKTPGAVTPNGLVTIESLRPRVEFYQNTTSGTGSVTISIYMKSHLADKDSVQVTYPFGKLVVLGPLSFNDAKPSFFAFISTLHEYDINTVRYSINPKKIELTLTKMDSSVKWSTWGAMELKDGPTQPDIAAPAVDAAKPAPQAAVISSTELTGSGPKVSGPPSYPTSSKRGPQNWDKVASDAAGNEKEEEQGDAGAFFNNLFRNSSDDVKRAMNKSMYESNGTVLSTDWADVGSKTVETAPPEGVEPKKWEK
jgi:suppressor of G2 allele of SKP1